VGSLVLSKASRKRRFRLSLQIKRLKKEMVEGICRRLRRIGQVLCALMTVTMASGAGLIRTISLASNRNGKLHLNQAS